MRMNHLAGETSPYLLQHAHNPVDWHPWGAEALERARAEDHPIFLSVGYAACHWCHVMERESFEDAATAAYLNANFVSIKVDREERPDIDAIYMRAVQALTGSRRLADDRLPDPRRSPLLWRHVLPEHRPSRAAVLLRRAGRGLGSVARAACRRRERGDGSGVVARADRAPRRRRRARRDRHLDAAVSALESGFDVVDADGAAHEVPPAHGPAVPAPPRGIGDAPRCRWPRRPWSGWRPGGSTTSGWRVPAAMPRSPPGWCPLREDALRQRPAGAHLSPCLELTRNRADLEVARSTLDFVAREMTLPDGVFAASLDADTDGEEGATYTWTSGEIRDALVAAGREVDVELFGAAFDVTAAGNWEGRTILRRAVPDAELAARTGVPEDEVLVAPRRGLPGAPGPAGGRSPRNDKALAGWNGLMLAAYADAAAILAHQPDALLAWAGHRYRAIAERAAERLLGVLVDERGRLRRSWKDGQARHAGTLEEHACLADGLLALHEATANERWFTAARDLAETILAHFTHPEGGFFDTADDAERLVARPCSLEDNALPSGNAMAALVLLRLEALTGEGRYADAAEGALQLVGTAPVRYPTAFAQWLQVLDWRAGPVDEIALVGEPFDPRLGALLDVARAGFRPRQVVAVAPNPATSAVPLMQARFALRGQPTAFVCRGFACRQPVTEPEALAALLAG